ncbi:hypothetical protein HID58_093658, partial [Brassica napus]
MAERVEGSVAEGENTIEKDTNLIQPMDEEANKLKNMYREKVLTFSIQEVVDVDATKTIISKLRDSGLLRCMCSTIHSLMESVIVKMYWSSFFDHLLSLTYTSHQVRHHRCKANDNGQGKAKLDQCAFNQTGLVYNSIFNVEANTDQQRSDEDLTTIVERCSLKEVLESKESRKRALLFIVLLGTCMMIGDEPSLNSSFSYWWDQSHQSKDEQRCCCACFLSSSNSTVQYATLWHRQSGWLFAPIAFIWFLFIGATGMYNICKHDTSVLKAFRLHILTYTLKTRTRRLDLARHCLLPLLAIQLAFTVLCLPLSSSYVLWTSCLSCEHKKIITKTPSMHLCLVGLLFLKLGPLTQCSITNTHNSLWFENYTDSVYWPMNCCCARDACYHVTNDPDHAPRVEVSLDLVLTFRCPHTSARVVYFSAVIWKINQGG